MGNVYGLTYDGFCSSGETGTIFVIDPGGSVRTVYTFLSSAGCYFSSLVKGSDGRFYVTSRSGGAHGFGAIFAIDAAGMLTTIHSFAGGTLGDGSGPAGLIQASDGRLYGTTSGGGQFGGGTVYALDLTGHYQVLHSFTGSNPSTAPGSDLLEASDGNLYGVTPVGSMLFGIDSGGTLTTHHDLGNLFPGELIQAADGRIYGTTAGGGLEFAGTIFTMELQGTPTTVHDFRASSNTGRPNGVIQARNGRFYGTAGTPNATAGTPSLPNIVFEMDAATGSLTILRTFVGSQGALRSNLFEGNDGSLYGTVFNDSSLPPFAVGPIFRLGPAGDYTVVTSASNMRAGVIQANDGRLYVPTAASSRFVGNTHGGVFSIETNGTAVKGLHGFTGGDSANPVAELVQIDDGSVYGTTAGSLVVSPGDPPVHGTIFRIDPATGAFTTRYELQRTRRLGANRPADSSHRWPYLRHHVGGWRIRIRHRLLARQRGQHSRRCITLPVPMAQTRARV